MSDIPIRYKVWVSVELIDVSNDHYEDVDGPMEVAEFDTEEEAMRFAETLYRSN